MVCRLSAKIKLSVACFPTSRKKLAEYTCTHTTPIRCKKEVLVCKSEIFGFAKLCMSPPYPLTNVLQDCNEFDTFWLKLHDLTIHPPPYGIGLEGAPLCLLFRILTFPKNVLSPFRLRDEKPTSYPLIAPTIHTQS